jgi:hypothetical protein
MAGKRPNRWIARYCGTCDLCGERITAGVDWISRQAGQNVHTICMQEGLTQAVRRRVTSAPEGEREVPDVLKGLT